MAIDTFDKVEDFCTVLVLTEDDADNPPVQCEPPLALSTDLAVEGNPLCLPDLTTKENVNSYFAGVVNVDIEKGSLDKLIISDETHTSTKMEIAITKPLRRQNSLQPGGESVRPFMNHILMLLKLNAKDKQRAHDFPNRRRKYKRPAVFDSRQIVLLFSIMSSMGTIVLIYLTLRVRQVGEGSDQLSRVVP